MGQFTIRHTFDCSADDFWEKTFKNQEFNKNLYLEKLSFSEYEVLEDRTDDEGKIHRRVRCAPPTDAPRAVKKVLGDSLSYVEEGVFDPSTKKYRFKIVPSKMADKFRSEGEFWVESLDDDRCERICSMSVDVKIFGVGGVIESFMEKQTKDSYEQAAIHTRRYLSDS